MMDGVEEGHKEEYYEVEDQRFLGPQGFGEMLENQTVEGESCFAEAKAAGSSLEKIGQEAGHG